MQVLCRRGTYIELWHVVSAEGAIDDDLVQSALEEGELLIIELGDEQLRDPADVDGRRFGEAGDAGLRERHHHTTGVGTRFVSADEAYVDLSRESAASRS